MEGIPWKDMVGYSLTVLAALTLLLGPSAVGQHQQSNVASVSISEGLQEVSFDEENLDTVVSGNMSVPEGNELGIASTNYSEEKGLLEASLRTEQQIVTANSSLEKVNYTLEAEFTRDIPSTVVVYGPLQDSEEFSR